MREPTPNHMGICGMVPPHQANEKGHLGLIPAKAITPAAPFLVFRVVHVSLVSANTEKLQKPHLVAHPYEISSS